MHFSNLFEAQNTFYDKILRNMRFKFKVILLMYFSFRKFHKDMIR